MGTVKETLVRALQRAGYDTITACELASAKVAELQASPPGRHGVNVGKERITIDVHPHKEDA
jgi:hypothetical protein